MLQLTRMTCEGRSNPLGIDSPPRLSWNLVSEERDQRQSAYQILVSSRPELLSSEKADRWDSGKVLSNETIDIPYAGKPLHTNERVYWKIIAWDSEGGQFESEHQFWQMGLLAASDWSAQWITDTAPRDRKIGPNTLPPCPAFRRSFVARGEMTRATLYATARGVYELSLNGRKVGDAHLAPGWTDYNKRIPVQAYDASDMLHAGENQLEILLGDGWFSGYIGFDRARDNYGTRPQALAQLEIEYADGSTERVGTDSSWQWTLSPIEYSDMLMGERYDSRVVAREWSPVDIIDEHIGAVPLVAQVDPPIRNTEELVPRTVRESEPGAYIFDLGQNMVGWARLRVTAPAGTEISLRFAEILNPDGSLYTTNLRTALQTDVYVCSGADEEIWEPRFTFHGFRYVEVRGFPQAPTLDAVTGCVIHSDTSFAGSFICSAPLVNQLQRNIVWGQRGNFLSIPTDCPQRDERLGWMGDAQIFVKTASYNADVRNFFEKWMDDVRDAQSLEGGFPDVAPRLVDMADGAPAWGNAGVIVPWTIYQAYDDKKILIDNYESMSRWIDYLESANPNGLWENRRNNDFGDWLSIKADTPKDLLATAYYAHDAQLMSKIATILDRPDNAARYASLFEKIKAAFMERYVNKDGRVSGETQTSYLLALHFDLLPADLRPAAARHLAENIHARGNRLSTGFVGVGYLCPVLTANGYHDLACKLLLNEDFPSWGYSIRHGATTIWERWDGWTVENGFQDPGMNSFNHYSLGSVGEWLFRTLGGIETDSAAPGFKQIIMAPQPGPGISFVRASYQSIRGWVRCEWTTSEDGIVLSVEIPANCSAEVRIPAAMNAQVTEGDRPLDSSSGVTPLYREEQFVACRIGSGRYRFAARR